MLAIAHLEPDPAATWRASVKGRDLTAARPARQFVPRSNDINTQSNLEEASPVQPTMESFKKRDRGAADSSADDLALPLLAAEEIQRDYSIPPLPRQEALTDGDPVIKPSARSRFVLNLVPFQYRVSRHEFAANATRKAAQRAAQRAAAGPDGPLPPPRSPLGLPVLPPTSSFIVAWCWLTLVLDLTYTAVLLPLAYAFSLHGHDSFLAFSLTVGLVFTLDLVVMLHRGVVLKVQDRTLYVDGWPDAARAYLRHGDSWLSVPVALSAPAQILAIFAVGAATGGGDNGVGSGYGHGEARQLGVIQVAVLVRGLRLVRLLMLQRQLFFGKPAVRHSRREVVLFFLTQLYVLAVLLTWLAALMLAIAHLEPDPAATWLASVKGRDLTAARPARQFVAAIYFVTVTACTVGYGDVSAGTPVEQIAAVFTIIVGVTFIAFSVKSMVDVLLEAALHDEGAQRVALLRNRARALATWSRWQSASAAVEERLLAFYLGPGLDHAIVDATWGRLLGELPAALRGEVLLHVLLRHNAETRPLGERLLAGVAPQDAARVLAQLEVEPLCMGHALCWAGDTAHSVWLLQEGALVALDGVLPSDAPRAVVRGPALIVPFDLQAWLDAQREQQLAGAPPHAHTHPHLCWKQASGRFEAAAAAAAGDSGGSNGNGGGGGGGGGVNTSATSNDIAERILSALGHDGLLPPRPPPCYATSYESTTNCFLYRMPLARLALVVRCLPAVRDNLSAMAARHRAAAGTGGGGAFYG